MCLKLTIVKGLGQVLPRRFVIPVATNQGDDDAGTDAEPRHDPPGRDEGDHDPGQGDKTGGVPEATLELVHLRASKHYDGQGMAALTRMIAVTNLFNRLNATTRQVADAAW